VSTEPPSCLDSHESRLSTGLHPQDSGPCSTPADRTGTYSPPAHPAETRSARRASTYPSTDQSAPHKTPALPRDVAPSIPSRFGSSERGADALDGVSSPTPGSAAGASYEGGHEVRVCGSLAPYAKAGLRLTRLNRASWPPVAHVAKRSSEIGTALRVSPTMLSVIERAWESTWVTGALPSLLVAGGVGSQPPYWGSDTIGAGSNAREHTSVRVDVMVGGSCRSRRRGRRCRGRRS
jgi:hypothetical protein